jgi:hypothetical protein
MGQKLAQWRQPMASRVALHLPSWVMHLASYRLNRMAIKMARKGSVFFSVINFLSRIAVAERPCYGQLKIKPNYAIVLYYVCMQMVFHGGPLTAMYAVLAIIAEGRQAIIVFDREAVEISYFLL